MKSLCLMLLLGCMAQASLIATLNVGTGSYPNTLRCTDRYTAPESAPSFDRACFVPNLASLAAPASSEVEAQGPMHISLASTGGSTAAGCNPPGCPFGDAEIAYQDLWTVTGGAGKGVLVLDVNQTLTRGSQYPYINFNQPGYNGTYLVIPFVYGEPFAFGYGAVFFSYDQGYGSGTWKLDMSPRFYESCDSAPYAPFGCAHATGTIASEFGDPFIAAGPAPQVIIPEPSTMGLIALALGGTILKIRTGGGR
jgi:hypothetical protein